LRAGLDQSNIGDLMKKTLFLAAFCVAASAAAAEEPSSPAANQTSSGDPLICRTQQDTTSLVGRVRICLTREQWARQRRNGPPARSRAPRSEPQSQ
jgi:hypothetical protein